MDELKPFWLSLNDENFSFISETCSIVCRMDEKYLKIVEEKLDGGRKRGNDGKGSRRENKRKYEGKEEEKKLSVVAKDIEKSCFTMDGGREVNGCHDNFKDEEEEDDELIVVADNGGCGVNINLNKIGNKKNNSYKQLHNNSNNNSDNSNNNSNSNNSNDSNSNDTINNDYKVLPFFCSFIRDLYNILIKCPSVISVPPFNLGALDVRTIFCDQN